MGIYGAIKRSLFKKIYIYWHNSLHIFNKMEQQKYSYGTTQPNKDQGDYTIIVKAYPDPNGKNTKEQLMAMVDKYKNNKETPMQIKFFKSKKQAIEHNSINEIKRIQQLAGINEVKVTDPNSLENDDIIYNRLVEMDHEQLVSDMLATVESDPSLPLIDYLRQYDTSDEDDEEI